MSNARRQLETARRYHEGLRALPATDAGHDQLRAFFENCWHVKDHAKEDLDRSLHDVFEKAAECSIYLMIAADVANRSKHVILKRIDRLGAAVTVKHIQAFDGPETRSATATYTIVLRDGSSYDAVGVADHALSDWETVLAKYGS